MRGLRMGLGLSRVAVSGGGGGSWTPASAPGLNFWVEAGDLTNLYTDNGTTHVAADGDAVYLWKDKSGQARNLVQTVAGERPLYKTDLTKPSIKFDGVDDILATAGNAAWGDGSGQLWMAIAFQTDATTQRELLALKNGGTFVADLYLSTTLHMDMNGSSGFEEDATAAGTIAINTPYVGIGTITTTQCEAFVDNVSNGAHTNTGTPSTSTAQLSMGNVGSAWGGRMFGILMGSGTLSSADRANIQAYMAALHP